MIQMIYFILFICFITYIQCTCSGGNVFCLTLRDEEACAQSNCQFVDGLVSCSPFVVKPFLQKNLNFLFLF